MSNIVDEYCNVAGLSAYCITAAEHCGARPSPPSTLASLPVLIFFIVLQRHFVNGLMAGSFKA
jgi:ABC-type maltose transport system permease subunit